MIDKELIKNISTKPGVYFWKDKDDNIIYVGKAKNLKARMKQYFDPNMKNSYKTQKMLEETSSFETFVFETETEALIFERSCIAKYKPKCNVVLPTQATFPYICVEKNKNNLQISLKNKYKKNPNAIYYGPLVKGKEYKELIKYLIHLLKSKDGLIINKMSEEEVNNAFLKAKKILKFDTDFKNQLQNKIHFWAENMEYLLAKQYKQIYELIYNKQNQQNLVLKTSKDLDVFGFYVTKDKIFISILHYRAANLINKSDFWFNLNSLLEDFISHFIEEYYAKNFIPEHIILPSEYQNLFINEELKKHLVFKNNKIYQNMLDIAYENAKNDLENKIAKLEKDNQLEQTIEKLSKILEHDANKFVIFDNSFMANTNEIVGAAFLYENGKLLKNHSRSFILKKEKSNEADLYYMYQNAYKFLKNNSDLVNIIFVDGGIYQIKSIEKALFELEINKPVFGLIKNNKHSFATLINAQNQQIEINDFDVFNFLTKIQFQVDKYAKNWFNKRHFKSIVNNSLENIEGIGKKTINKLLEHFLTYENIYLASQDELEKIVSKKIAKKIKQLT